MASIDIDFLLVCAQGPFLLKSSPASHDATAAEVTMHYVRSSQGSQ
jgi:hypothetical protein